MATALYICYTCNITFANYKGLSIHRARSTAHKAVDEPAKRSWSRSKKRSESEAFEEMEGVGSQGSEDVQGCDASTAADRDECVCQESDDSSTHHRISFRALGP